MRLPEGLEREYKEQLKEYERSKTMPYVTSIERIGREEGRVEAVLESILEVLEARLGAVPSEVRQRLTELKEINQLKRLLRQAGTCASLAEFQRALEI